MSISCLKLNYLSTVIPQTIINELLAGTVPLKNHLPELFQRKNKENISGAFNYSRRLLHTHACYTNIYVIIFMYSFDTSYFIVCRMDVTFGNIDFLIFRLRF